ncbi:hypothetical protein IQ07DRAFT_567866 [Pyrenochaeta sp. DS3sAY3a]|nr:hypothetical protein IQ07DRAFT_567866 [Pyrenochaeta sp. DS3sAY3a]
MAFLYARQNPLDEARNTLSSWDNCMAKNYCKWPVIVAIVVGSLILISIVTCIARCICCGAECACCCFKCCTGCCGGGGRSGHKRMNSGPAPAYPQATPFNGPSNPYSAAYAQAPPAPPIDSRPLNQQYRSNAMPTFTPAPPPEPPQYATFSSPTKPVNEDALPAMPTWKDGRDVHVEVEQEALPEKRGDLEMDRLDHNGSVTNGSMTAMAAVGGARRSPGSGRSPNQHSPTDSYGFPPGYQNDSFVGAGPQRNSPSPYNRPYAQQDEYRRGSPGPRSNLSPVYGAGEGYGQNQRYENRSPAQQQPYNQYSQQDRYDDDDRYDQPAQRYHSPSPPPANNYNYNQSAPSYDNFAPAQQQPRVKSPGYPVDEPARYASPVSAYPGQQTYQSEPASYPGQQAYQAFQPAAPQSQQYTGVSRKAVDGSYREI